MSVVDKPNFLKHIWQKTLADSYLFFYFFCLLSLLWRAMYFYINIISYLLLLASLKNTPWKGIFKAL